MGGPLKKTIDTKCTKEEGLRSDAITTAWIVLSCPNITQIVPIPSCRISRREPVRYTWLRRLACCCVGGVESSSIPTIANYNDALLHVVPPIFIGLFCVGHINVVVLLGAEDGGAIGNGSCIILAFITSSSSSRNVC